MRIISTTISALVLLGALSWGGVAHGQVSVGTVDLPRIRKESPAFKKARDGIDRMVKVFERRRDRKRDELDKLASDLRDTEQRGLQGSTERLRSELQDKSQAFQKFMKETFGTDGIIESKTSEQLKPLYDDLAQAAENVAKDKGLDLVLDLEQVNPLFSSERLDITDDILKEFARIH